MNQPSSFAWIPWLLVITSCGSPPKPPTVDESRKRPANTAAEIELQVCRSDLANTRILASESVRSAESSRQAMSRLAAQQRLIESQLEVSRAPARNLLVPVLFAFGSARLSMPDTEAARILEEARTAPLVVLRGRTDGIAETPAESMVARQRTFAVEAWLVRSGVERSRIRSTWQAVGDHAADNTIEGGRALNRRVEIEIYRAAPLVAVASAHPTSTPARPAID